MPLAEGVGGAGGGCSVRGRHGGGVGVHGLRSAESGLLLGPRCSSGLRRWSGLGGRAMGRCRGLGAGVDTCVAVHPGEAGLKLGKLV